MRALFFPLGFAVLGLLSWTVYDRWDSWTEKSSTAMNGIAVKVKSSLPTDPNAPVSTTVYQWKDAQGHWQFSNTAPQNQKGVVSESYHSGQNVIPRAPVALPMVSGKEEKSNGVFSHFADSVNEARNIQNTALERNAEMERQLENALH